MRLKRDGELIANLPDILMKLLKPDKKSDYGRPPKKCQIFFFTNSSNPDPL
jgi:hypothetical protein